MANYAIGAEVKENREQWAAQQADLQSLDSFCFSTQTARPATAQSPYSLGRRPHARARPASAAVPSSAARPRTPQLWSGLTGPQQPAGQQPSTSGAIKAKQPSSPAAQAQPADLAAGVAQGRQQPATAAHHANMSPAAVTDNATATAACQSHAGSRPGSPDAEAAGAAVTAPGNKKRPASAQPQVQTPGVFLRSARPQPAGAANVRQAKALQLGVNAFNEPKRDSGWVDFRAQNRMGKRVRPSHSFV